MTKTTQTLPNEKILSIRRAIETKKKERGLTSPILLLKSLKKYRDLKSINYPQSIYKRTYCYAHYDCEGCFEKVKYPDILPLKKHQHLFDKIVNDISKMMITEMEELGLTAENTTADEVMTYLSRQGIEGYTFKKVMVTPELQTAFRERQTKKHMITDELFGYAMLNDFKLSQVPYFWSIERSSHPFPYPIYTLLTTTIKKAGTYTGKNAFKGKKAHLMDFVSFLAKATLLRLTGEYLAHSELNRQKIETKMTEAIVHSAEDLALFQTLTPSFIMEVFERNNGLVPDYFRSLSVLTLELMIQESMVLTDYENRLTKISGTYATSYMTKKNIPQKVQDYMADNRFLTMFGYVEADEKCDLDLLKALEEQFCNFAKQLPLLQVKDHALRFRRLGKLKAAGVYFPGANTLAINLDDMDAFTHEYFHLIDFTQGLLSLDESFKPLVERYHQLTEATIEKLPKTHELVLKWQKTSSKYSKDYYLSPEETFARLGEIYVANCLNIDSSFNQTTFKSFVFDETTPVETVVMDQVVYPQDPTFIEMIRVYFDDLFDRLKQENHLVQVDESDEMPTESTFDPSQVILDETSMVAMCDCFSEKGTQLSLF